MAFNLIGLCILAACFALDRHKTIRSVHRGLMMFWKIVPEMSIVLILISISLSVLTPTQLRQWLSADTPAHFVLALAVGSVALIPGFVAFPLAGVLLKNGASITLVAGFLTTLLMVGVVTLPMEARYFGWRTALLRNGLSFIGAVAIALAMGRLL
ncbi:MAG: permease [Armatimonadetes bacterium]|nr:permease [Armatimonadota bacterium]